MLTKLTGDFERFESILLEQRNMLEHRAGQSVRDDEIDRESSQFRLEASEMAMRTQRALEQLRRPGEVTRLPAQNGSPRSRARGLARDQRQG